MLIYAKLDAPLPKVGATDLNLGKPDPKLGKSDSKLSTHNTKLAFCELEIETAGTVINVSDR